MNLHTELVKRIDDFGGLQKIIIDLKKQERTAPWNRKVVFSGMIIFLKQLYRGSINLQWCALGHRKLSKFIISYYTKWGERKNCETMLFVADLIEYKLEAHDKIRELA